MNGPGKATGAVGILMVTTLAAGCGPGLADLPLPTPSAGGASYTVTATFSNALNLPNNAKVKLAGADVGEVESMKAQNYAAVVTMRIRTGVVLPVGTTAELRSATPLGDVFVSVVPPPSAGPGTPAMRNGDSIPIAATSAAATIEEVLTSASLLVNGGAIGNLTKLVNSLGAAVGGKGRQLSDLVDQSTKLLGDLSARGDRIDAALRATDSLTATLAAQQSSIGDAVAAAAPALQVISDNTGQILDLVERIDSITAKVSEFPSVRGVNTQSLVDNIDQISADLSTAATAPGASLARLNQLIPTVIKVTDSTSGHVDVDLQDVAAGAVPDFAHPGDPGSRLPDGQDVTDMVGTLAYTLQQLQAKFQGQAK